MIAPFYARNPMGEWWVQWMPVRSGAGFLAPYFAWGDHGYYCPIKWEEL